MQGVPIGTSVNGGYIYRYPDGSTGTTPVKGGAPIPTPTPPLAAGDPRQNPNLVTGSRGPHVPVNSQPIASVLGANTMFDNGAIYPNSMINQNTSFQQTGTGSTPTTDGGGGDTGRDFAYEAWRSAIDQANRIRNSGRATFDDLIKAVGAFRDRAKTQRDDSGQEITNRFGEIMGQTGLMGRQTATDAARRGRALGLGDSSKFRNQNLVAGNLALQQGGNLAKRGENERANEALYQERLDQAQGQEDQANRYLRDINDYASGVETQGMHNYANTLSSLIDRANQLAALKPLNAGSLQAYQTDTSGLTNVLNGLLGSMQSRQISGGDMAANLANPVDIFSLNDPRRNRGLVK